MPAAPGTDLIIEHQERRFIMNHKRVVKKLRAMLQAEGVQEEEQQPEEMELEIPDNLDEWEQAARAAAARPGVAGRITTSSIALSLEDDPVATRHSVPGRAEPIVRRHLRCHRGATRVMTRRTTRTRLPRHASANVLGTPSSWMKQQKKKTRKNWRNLTLIIMTTSLLMMTNI